MHQKESEGLSDYFDENQDLENLEISAEEEKESESSSLSNDDAPIVKFINRIIVQAIKKGSQISILSLLSVNIGSAIVRMDY